MNRFSSRFGNSLYKAYEVWTAVVVSGMDFTAVATSQWSVAKYLAFCCCIISCTFYTPGSVATIL